MVKTFKLCIFILLLLSTKGGCFAQLLEVDFFGEAQYPELVPERDRIYDINGELCALIKVQIVDTSVVFEGGVSLSYPKGHNEWWVWISTEATHMTVKSSSNPPCPVIFDKYGFEHLEKASHQTYILRLVQSTRDTASSYPNVLSYMVPGLGQIELGNKTEGYAIIIGETFLLGGGIVSSISANNQLEVMRDIDVSLEDYMSAKSNYTTLQLINTACYVAAATLYGFHLYRVYHLSKQARRKEYASLTPLIINTGKSMSFGLCLNFNF